MISTLTYPLVHPINTFCASRVTLDLSSTFLPEQTAVIVGQVQSLAESLFAPVTSQAKESANQLSFWSHPTFLKITSFLDRKIPEKMGESLLKISFLFAKHGLSKTEITDIHQLDYGSLFGPLTYLHTSFVLTARELYASLSGHYQNELYPELLAHQVRNLVDNTSVNSQSLDGFELYVKSQLAANEESTGKNPLTYREALGATGKWAALTALQWYPRYYILSSVTEYLPEHFQMFATTLAICWYMNRLLPTQSLELVQKPVLVNIGQTENLRKELANKSPNKEDKEAFSSRLTALDLTGARPFAPIGNSQKVLLQAQGNVITQLAGSALDWVFTKLGITEPAPKQDSTPQDSTKETTIKGSGHKKAGDTLRGILRLPKAKQKETSTSNTKEETEPESPKVATKKLPKTPTKSPSKAKLSLTEEAKALIEQVNGFVLPEEVCLPAGLLGDSLDTTHITNDAIKALNTKRGHLPALATTYNLKKTHFLKETNRLTAPEFFFFNALAKFLLAFHRSNQGEAQHKNAHLAFLEYVDSTIEYLKLKEGKDQILSFITEAEAVLEELKLKDKYLEPVQKQLGAYKLEHTPSANNTEGSDEASNESDQE